MSRLKGATRARARARAMPKVLKKNVSLSLGETIASVEVKALRNMDAMVEHRTGTLRRHYKKALLSSSLIGRVGYVTKAAGRAAFYARFVHDGTESAKARPFHDWAVIDEMGPHRARMREALRKSVGT